MAIPISTDSAPPMKQRSSYGDKEKCGRQREGPRRTEKVYKGHLKYSPNNKILHSLLNRLLSSSICLSIASERSFPERSAVDTQPPILGLVQGQITVIVCRVGCVWGCGIARSSLSAMITMKCDGRALCGVEVRRRAGEEQSTYTPQNNGGVGRTKY